MYFLQQTLFALDFLSPVSRHLFACQALVAVRRVLLAQFSAFPANGADLYEELKTSTAILPTGSLRWVHRLVSQQVCRGWACCKRPRLPRTGFEQVQWCPNRPQQLL